MSRSRFCLFFLSLWTLAILAFPQSAPAAVIALPITAGPVRLTAGPVRLPPAPLPVLRGGTLSPYVDPQQFFGVPFGSHSPWAQPWRGYLETVPAGTFLEGVGTVWTGGDPAADIPKLAAAGVRVLRIEIGWGNVDYDDPTRLDNADALGALLQYCKQYGIRPLILLNGNQGVPCPTRYDQAIVAAPVQPGDTTITLTDASAVVPNHTGLTNVSGYTAARPLFTAVSGNVVTLSQPCPCALAAGQAITLTTLKYAPFTMAGSDEYNATVAGWQQYVLTVAKSACSELGPGGFDLEIWNELTFGSDFRNGANYGLAAGPDMTTALVQITADLAAQNPALFAGVGISDGFASTTPWPAASQMPAAITAISKHPYANQETFPQDNYPGTTLNALFLPDGWVPSYTEHFPEYFATWLQTESMIRDMAPLPSDIYDTAHGRYARGQDSPVSTWITEYRLDPDAVAAPDEVFKSILRFYCFYLGKGVTKACWYSADDLLAQPQALDALSRIEAVMSDGLDRNAPPRSVSLLSVSDTHGHAQFQGDGTPAHPALYDRDVFAFLPYQVNARRFVVPYYVMTRDVAKDLPAEAFTLKLSGLGMLTSARTYDPMTGRYSPVQLLLGSSPSLTVSATDNARLLVLDDVSPRLPIWPIDPVGPIRLGVF